MSRPGTRIPYQPISRSQKQAMLFRVQFLALRGPLFTYELPQVLYKDSGHLKACLLNFELNLQKKIVRFQKRPI